MEFFAKFALHRSRGTLCIAYYGLIFQLDLGLKRDGVALRQDI